MSTKYIPKSIRNWIKKKIRNNYNRIKTPKSQFKIKREPSEIYFPYMEESQSFVIPKQKEELEKCELDLPIPPKNLWLGYGKNITEYLYGKQQIDMMTEILKSAGYELSEKKRILDFGCGAGRMIRWLKPYAGMCEIWGTDISADHIIWAKGYLNPPFNFATTTIIPHLPFEDGYFNLIYAGSVFTHIDDLADAWLLELKRILSPEGLLYITLQDNNSIMELDNNPTYKELWIAHLMNKNSLYTENKTNYRIIVNGRGPASQVFYDREIFCQSIKTSYEVLSINDNAYGYQTGYLLKRK